MIEKILLDTDIGSDIDDAVCLAYLLANPECELIGITTVTGEAVRRAQMASALCKVAGKDVPIYPGAETPLVVAQKQPLAPQADALVNWEHETNFPVNQAIHFLQNTIRSHPGEITLLAIGPLTNIGLLFRMDPDVPKLLKRLVLMCGVFTDRRPGVGPLEWNAIGDPHATAIVYRSHGAVHRSIGLDVTTLVKMHADEVRKRFQVKLLRTVLDFAEVWFKQQTDQITFHDPLAATTIFSPAICTFMRGNVEVELLDEALIGATRWKADPAGNHEVALEVSQENFFDHYFSFF